MVTASHNDNGWTGVKIEVNRPLTLGDCHFKFLKAAREQVYEQV